METFQQRVEKDILPSLSLRILENTNREICYPIPRVTMGCNKSFV